METNRKYFGGWVTNPGKLSEISRLKWGFQRNHPTKLRTYGALKFEPTSGDRISNISRILVWCGFAKKSACCSYSWTNNVMLSIPTALGWRLNMLKSVKSWDTVDGRNPAPVDVVDIPEIIMFYTSQVVQDFFHQQYHGIWYLPSQLMLCRWNCPSISSSSIWASSLVLDDRHWPSKSHYQLSKPLKN